MKNRQEKTTGEKPSIGPDVATPNETENSKWLAYITTGVMFVPFTENLSCKFIFTTTTVMASLDYSWLARTSGEVLSP